VNIIFLVIKIKFINSRMKSLAIAGLAVLAGSVTARSNVQGNNNHGILGVDSSSSQLRNNHGIINVFGKDGNHNAPGNKGFINVLPFHIVRDDDDELFNLIHVDVDNQKYNVHHNSGRVIINADDDDELFAFDSSSFNMSGNQGKIHFNTDTPVEQMKNVKLSKNQGQITQTDSTGKTTVVDHGKSDSHAPAHPRPHHPKDIYGDHPHRPHHPRDIHSGKPKHGDHPRHPQVKPGKPTKPIRPVEPHPDMSDMGHDMAVMNSAMDKMRVDMQPMKESRGFLSN